jgi:hypothetical protein
MKPHVLIERLSLQTAHLTTVLTQLSRDLIDIKARIEATTPPTSVGETAYLERLTESSEQIEREVAQLKASIEVLAVRSREASAAALGS